MSNRNELRRYQRELVDGKVKLSWQDAKGINRMAIGRCINVSQTGLQIETPDAVPAQTYVSFRIEEHSFHGSGAVRYCRRSGLHHRIGLEFGGGLRWAPTERLAKA